jgi:hypothetical protein
MTANELAQKFIAQAKAVSPAQRDEVLRNAAYTFVGLAQNPKHTRGAKKLTAIGLDFAKAASRAQPVVTDDFTDILRETQQAYDEVGDDPMDLVARRRQVHEERTPMESGRVSIAPESFNRDATLGRSAEIKFNPTDEEKTQQGIQQIQNVAFWQGVKKEAQAMTVDVNLVFLPPLPSDFGDDVGAESSVRLFAEVEYGSDGNRTKVKFDIALGKRLTVVGNYIAVTVGADPPMKVLGVSLPTVPVTVGASIGTFAAPSTGPVVLTEYVDSLSNVGIPPISDMIPVPLKAVMLLPMQTSLALGGTATLDWFSYGGAFISRDFYLQAANSTMLPIPITGDVSFVRITNTGAGTANFRLPFQLAL